MNNKYFALRHGQSKANVLKLVLSSLEDGKKEEYSLTPQGENQVRLSVKKAKASEVLGNETIICASPFSRTKKSAEIAKEVLGVESDIIFDERLRERWFGDLEKKSYEVHEKVWAADLKNPQHKEKNVESAVEVQKRVMSLINDLEEKYQAKKILLVSHGDTLNIMQTGFKSVSPSRHRELNPLDAAEIRELK